MNVLAKHVCRSASRIFHCEAIACGSSCCPLRQQRNVEGREIVDSNEMGALRMLAIE